MASATEKSTKPNADAFTFPQIEMPAINGDLFLPYVEAGQAFFENAMAWNQEIIDFASERLDADTEALQNLSRCGSLEELVSAQTDFASSVVDAYGDEIPKLMEQAARTCTSIWPLAEDSTRA